MSDSLKGHLNNIPTMQFFTGISRNTQAKSYLLSLTECVWVFQVNASWDTHLHAICWKIQDWGGGPLH